MPKKKSVEKKKPEPMHRRRQRVSPKAKPVKRRLPQRRPRVPSSSSEDSSSEEDALAFLYEDRRFTQYLSKTEQNEFLQQARSFVGESYLQMRSKVDELLTEAVFYGQDSKFEGVVAAVSDMQQAYRPPETDDDDDDDDDDDEKCSSSDDEPTDQSDADKDFHWSRGSRGPIDHAAAHARARARAARTQEERTAADARALEERDALAADIFAHLAHPVIHTFNATVTRDNCPFCGCVLYGNESSVLCCSNGKHVLQKIDVEIPPPFQEWFEENREIIRTFSRALNLLVSISAIGVRSGTTVLGGIGKPYEEHTYQISGRCFHFREEITSEEGDFRLGSAASYFSAESDLDYGVATNNEAVAEAVRKFRNLLRGHNGFIQQLLHLVRGGNPWVSRERADTHVIHFAGNSQPLGHQTYGLFQVNGNVFQRPETEVLMLTEEEMPDASIVRQFKSWKRTDAGYERSAFMLSDPMGQSGWWEVYHRDTRTKERFRDGQGEMLTLREYTRYKALQSKMFPLMPSLYQEWLLDCTSRYEEISQMGIVHAMERHAGSSRAEGEKKSRGFFPDLRYAKQREVLHAQASGSGTQDLGRLWRIPSSVRGSSAYRKQNVDKGMAMVYALGSPTVFITMTCNVHWPEIVSNLKPGNSWHDEPDLVNRVFKQKLEMLLDGLKRGAFFGNRAAYIQYCIEFQKRGCPHAHILARIAGAQPTHPHEVDKLVSAQLPDACATNCGTCNTCRLKRSVETHMIHKCIATRCHKNNKKECHYGFPFPATPVSTISSRGRWNVKRRLCDSMVVAYNPELMLAFDCHMNVEVSSSTRSIYYLRKYLSKGPDTVPIAVTKKCRSLNDELNAFYEHRCLTAFEASWQMLSFEFSVFWPQVIPVKLCLPGDNLVFFDPNEPEEAYANANSIDDALVKYLKRPIGVAYDSLLFVEYFSQFTVKPLMTAGGNEGKGDRDSCEPQNRVLPRRDGPVIAFVSNVNYANCEQFSLFILLKSIATRSLVDLLSGRTAFFDAAVQRGLLSEDDIHMTQAVFNDLIERGAPPDRILRFFITLLITETQGIEDLFHTYYQYFSDIVPHRSEHDSMIAAIGGIQSQLAREGIDILDTFKSCSTTFRELIMEAQGAARNRLIEARFERTPHQDYLTGLNEEQVAVLHEITDRIANGAQSKVYINGNAGSGKTRLLNALWAFLEEKKILMCAFTGVAAGLLPNGSTAHRVFGLPTDENQGTSSIGKNSLLAEIIRKSDVLVVDEVSMLHKRLLEIIDMTARSVCDSPHPFGGKHVVIAGDFQQIPAVVKVDDRLAMKSKTLQASLALSPMFDWFHVLRLTNPCRFSDIEFAHFLQRVGRGEFPDDPDRSDEQFVELPPRIRTFRTVAEATAHFSEEFGAGTPLLYLAPTHQKVNDYNEMVFEKMSRGKEVYTQNARYEMASLMRHSIETVHKWVQPGVPNHELHFFEGQQVMLMRNIFPSKKLANGSLATIVKVNANTILVRSALGEEIEIPRIRFAFCIQTVDLQRIQYPFVEAYGGTINKAQGQTLRKLILDLSQDVFMHGQLYVALSRVSCCEDIVIITPNAQRIVKSVVYKEILRAAKIGVQ